MPPKSLKPGTKCFRNSGWLPKSKEASDKFFHHLRGRRTRDVSELLPPVQEFKDFIEKDPTVYLEFNRMFDNIPKTEYPSDYLQLIDMFNHIFRTAPNFGELGPPVYMAMANVMNSQGGFSAFTKGLLNQHFKKMMETWVVFLLSKESRYVLNKADDGWFSSAAINAMMKDFDPGRTFEQVFLCDSKAEFYGFTSFEEFFNRRLREPGVDRPTGPIDDLRLISAACESTTYAYQENVKRSDPLFIKDEAYSLVHLLADNYVDHFVGGSVLQSFLNTTSYHRWHAPVNGTIKKVVSVPGTYFAQAPFTIGMPTDHEDEAPPYLQSLQFFANTAARMLIFIEADNKKLGLICFIAIGMTEISSCEATVFDGEKVQRGDQLGMFHFGGSSSALVFSKKADVKVDSKFTVPEAVLKINEPIATVATA